MAEISRLSTPDYIVFALMLAISAAIGVYFRFTGGKQTTTKEYLLAGRNMPMLPVAFSLMATFKSAIAFVGFPSEMYLHGTAFWWSQIWQIPGSLVAGYLFFPAYFDLQCSTAYEFLRRRFGPVMRVIGCLAFLGQMIMYMSVVLYAPALALSAVTSMSLWISIVSIGIVCTLYCTLGGMKAVLWTDAFQAVLMYMGLFTMIIKGCVDLGGGGNVIRIANEGGRFVIPSFRFDFTTRYTFWNVIFQGFLISAATYGCSQIQVQRVLTVKDVKIARRALFVSVAMSFSFMTLLACIGIVMYAYFKDCDPLSSPRRHLDKNDQIISLINHEQVPRWKEKDGKKRSSLKECELLPYYAMIALEKFPGLPGLCISSIFSAALSTISSAVSSLTAVTMEDFILPLCGSRKTCLSNSVLFAKILTLIYGGVCILGTLVVAEFGGVLQATLTIFGIFRGPLLGAFFLGMFTTTANEPGVAVATLSSIAIVAWSNFGAAAAKVKQPTLSLSTEGCPANASYSDVEVFDFLNATVTSLNDTINSDMPDEKMRYVFPLYKVSFMWAIGIGFFLTVVAGYCFSIVINIIRGTKPKFEPECLNPMMRKILLPNYKGQSKAQEGKNGVFHAEDKTLTQRRFSKNGTLNVSFEADLKDEQSTRF